MKTEVQPVLDANGVRRVARLSDVRAIRRGRTHLPGPSAVPVKAQVPALAEGMDAQEAFAEIGRSCLAQVQANERGAGTARNLEFLHQYRVGLRRLRSAFGLFRPVLPPDVAAVLIWEMRWLGARLGPARDWGVFCEQALNPLWERAGREPALAALRLRCARERAACAAKVHEAIASPRYARLVLRLERLFANPGAAVIAPPLKAFAAARLEKRDKTLRKSARNLDVSDPTQIHGMRIAVKKLRYSAEFLQSLFSQQPVRDHTRSLARLQDVLGDVNDSAAGMRLLDSLPPDRNKGSAYARRMVREWLVAGAENNLGALPGCWDELRRQKRYWKSALPSSPLSRTRSKPFGKFGSRSAESDAPQGSLVRG